MILDPHFQSVGRALLLIGAVVMACGALLLFAPHIPGLGRLPGDLLIRRDRVTFYFPLVSCLVASLVLSVIFWLVRRFHP